MRVALFAAGSILAMIGAVSGLSRASVAAASSGKTIPPSEIACPENNLLQVGGATIQLYFDAGDFPQLTSAEICAWTMRAAMTVSTYFGHFPVHHLNLRIEPENGSRVLGGTTYGWREGGSLTIVRLGRDAPPAKLDSDWVMTHEMVHLAVPSVPENSHWLEEGIATYVEPIARAQSGELGAQKVWGDMVEGMPHGLPGFGDRGLDHTATWGRTYWGGAMFCLLADVEIRKRTDNRKSLRDALRGVLTAGGNIQQDWTAAQVFAAADKAIGEPVLTELYASMANAPVAVDLDALWRQLGVEITADQAPEFLADAPLSGVRFAMTAPLSAAAANSGIGTQAH